MLVFGLNFHLNSYDVCFFFREDVPKGTVCILEEKNTLRRTDDWAVLDFRLNWSVLK